MSSVKVQVVGGQFQDSEGNPLSNGYLMLEINQDEQIPGIGQLCSGITVKVQLDGSGNASTSPAQFVWPNDILLPINSYYKVIGYTQFGQLAFGPTNQQILSSPSPFNLNAWVPNVLTNWTPPLQNLAIEVNGTPSSSQSLLNLISGSNTSITDGGGGNITFASTGGGGGGSITLQVNGVNAGSQTLLNMFAGSNMTISDNGFGKITFAASQPTLPTFQVNGVNTGSQSLVNLVAGGNMTITDNGLGSITFAATGTTGVSSFNGRTGIVVPQTGDYTAAQVTNALDLSINTYNANQVLASPNGSTGVLSVRSLVALDIPPLGYISNASVAGNLVVASPNGSSGVPSPRALVGADLPILNSTGKGFIWSTGQLTPVMSIGTGNVVANANEVRAYQFTLPAGVTIQNITITVNAAVAASTMNVGIYTGDGNTKLIDSGTFNTANATTQTITLGSPVTLTPGVYFFAQSSNNTGVVVDSIPMSAGLFTKLNANAGRAGTAANSQSGSNLPATLGGITGSSTISPVLALFER